MGRGFNQSIVTIFGYGIITGFYIPPGLTKSPGTGHIYFDENFLTSFVTTSNTMLLLVEMIKNGIPGLFFVRFSGDGLNFEVPIKMQDEKEVSAFYENLKKTLKNHFPKVDFESQEEENEEEHGEERKKEDNNQ